MLTADMANFDSLLRQFFSSLMWFITGTLQGQDESN